MKVTTAATGLALAAALALPASASAAWSTPDTATRAGTTYDPQITVGVRQQLTAAWVRQLGDRSRVEVRRGTVRGGLRGPALVLDQSTSLIGDVAMTSIGDTGAVAVAWVRYVRGSGPRSGNHRVQGVIVDADGTAGPVRALSGGGESAYDPHFASGGGSVALTWSRRTFSQSAPVTADGFGAVARISGAPIFGPFAAVDGAGTTVAVRFPALSGGGLSAAERDPGATAFGAERPIPGSGGGGNVKVAGLREGGILATWRRPGGALAMTLRDSGGTFGAPIEVVPAPEGAEGTLAGQSAAGEILVAYRRGASGEEHGELRYARLTATGMPVGTRRLIAPAGGTSAPAMANDISGTFFGWSADGNLRVRRFAPGGIAGTTFKLGRADQRVPPAMAGLRTMGAVAAWVSGGRVLISHTG